MKQAETQRVQHTPGPWVAVIDPMVGGCRDITTVEGGLLAATAGISNDEMDEANARMIAAAPELAEALKHAIYRNHSYSETCDGCLAAANALKKAGLL